MSAPHTTLLQVSGMTCNNCARKVTVAAQAVTGVHSVTVNVPSAQASIRWQDASAQNVAAVLAAITQAGFEAREVTATSSRQSRWQWTLIVGLSVTFCLMLGEWGLHLDMKPWFQWTAFALAGIVQIYCGAAFYKGAWRQLKVGESNMDTLVALGSTTAFGYSTWALLGETGGHLYFMEAAAIISLISAGHWFEARVSDQASSALKSLLNLAPQTARKIQSTEPARAATAQPFNLKNLSFAKTESRPPAAETEVEVPVATLKTGDRIALRPGDRVPVDGVVVTGESAVDEAMLTGTVNLNGRLVMRVTATGEATALAHIIAAVQRAQTSRANIQRLGDRISNIFVPVIVCVALAAGLWWGLAPASAARVHEWLTTFLWHSHNVPTGLAAGFIIAAAVLIVACPCAMGLATPAAIMASANTAARRGILIRDGVALEKAGLITAVLFDKTGTITLGRPGVVKIWENPDWKTVSALELAASLAGNSTHPVSRAIAPLAAGKIPLAQWQEISGAGVTATCPATTEPAPLPAFQARLGSLRWLAESGVETKPGAAFIAEWTAQGATMIGLAAGTELVALFAVRDTVKAHAAAVIQELQAQALKTFLVTGDSRQTAIVIAESVGIPPGCVFAEVRPEQKAELVKKLQAQGERVAFVGDGINDAPALTQADLGIAVSRASDIAREAADIILLKSEIEAVPEALGLARATLRTIKQNLFWAFFYNSLGVPLAALGFISPVFCAAAMGVSDLIVIGNALRLLRWKNPRRVTPASKP
jgi:P-type Cu+ transporter